jgi:hypothetical protein
MSKKLLGSAVAMVGLAADAARHLAWYLNHQVSGSPRKDGSDRPDDRT